MANSKLPPANKKQIATRVDTFFTRVFQLQPQPIYRVLVAFSGGIDSTVLFHALVHLQRTLQADASAPFQLQLSAMHVHHGLSPNANLWASHCETVCAQFSVPFDLRRIHVDSQSGLGIEASARNARYAVLYAAEADFICLAHHQNDQAETLLLQLARGAGAKGLSGMAAMDFSRRLLRPLLEVSRPDIERYAKQHALQWVEDESNLNLQFDRNFIRQSVMPLLAGQYSGIEKTLGRTAQHLAEANILLAELAEMDVRDASLVNASDKQSTLAIDGLRALSAPRAKNVLRWWLELHALPMPNTETLTQLLQQLLHARGDAAVCVKVGPQHSVRRYARRAYVVIEETATEPFSYWWQGESVVPLTAYHRLVFETCTGKGIAMYQLGETKLLIKTRLGGERFKPELGRPSRTLQHVLQAHAIPPWQRAHYPLVFAAETLVCIPNIGVDANMTAQPNEQGLSIRLEAIDC
ncbi:tRNA lysidine(34) synthetase TilS [Methylotenera sp. 1P/1]|uniref:tRNA lysidine(34) synthetase TilS n=1 Tax=Methylotenera sp. 1P/1 TaxID=1131551 RepID=UPI0003655894|nr:tRNA lysidine(34) synthetase TilS [Methylotenera sp. 1P/1]